MTLVRLRGLSKAFGATVALESVDLTIAAGEVVAIIGENGAGKSTLLNIIAGAMDEDGGETEVSGKVAYIRQELALFPHLSVAENVWMGREPSRLGFVDGATARARTRALLEEFGRPEIDPDERVGNLPPASRQVVEISRALADDAKIVLMDEPTSSLERTDVSRLFAAIETLRTRGIAILYVSHFLEEVREIASRAVVLRDGKSVWTGELGSVTDRELISHMVGRSHEEAFEPIASTPTLNTAMTVDSVLGANFTLRRGEILGIAGLVGSGRTELIRALFGLDPVASGCVTVRDRATDARELSPANGIAAGLGYLSEDRGVEGVFPDLSVRENLGMTRLAGRDVSPWIDRLRIKVADVESSVMRLSGGNQQKVLLARLLHQGAEVLLLDEPTRGIDVSSKAEIYAHLRALAGEGKAIVVVSSYLPELFSICDSLAVMVRGRLSEVRPIDAWTPDTVIEAAISAPAEAA